jgi:hypothetical protein
MVKVRMLFDGGVCVANRLDLGDDFLEGIGKGNQRSVKAMPYELSGK